MSRRVAVLFIAMGLALLLLPLVPRSLWNVVVAKEILAESWTLPIPVPLSTLSPQKVLSATEKSFMLLTFSRLVKVGTQLQIEPDVAEKWAYDSSRKKLLLTIRRGLKFHDGNPLTSRDVMFSFHEWARAGSLDHDLLNPILGVREYAAGKNSSIVGVHAVDEHNISVELVGLGGEQVIRNLSEARFCIYPYDFGDKTREQYFESPIGTGPYRIHSYSPDRIEYRANLNYHFGAPFTKQITLLFLSEVAAIEAFRRREIDNLIMYHLSDVSQLGGEGVIVKRLSRASTFNIIFNTTDPVLADEAIRHTLAAKIPKAELATDCFPGSEITESYIPSGFIGGLTEPASYKPHQLKALPPNFEMTLYTLKDENGDCTARTLARSFAGMPIRTQSRTFTELYAMLKAGRLHVWAESAEFKSDDPYQNLRYFTAASNEFLLGNPVRSIEKAFLKLASGTVSLAERADIYQSIDRDLVEHAHIVPILNFGNYAAYRSNLENLEFLRTGRFSANWHKIKVHRSDSSAH